MIHEPTVEESTVIAIDALHEPQSSTAGPQLGQRSSFDRHGARRLLGGVHTGSDRSDRAIAGR
jgi:hypothetical protein